MVQKLYISQISTTKQIIEIIENILGYLMGSIISRRSRHLRQTTR